MKIETKGETDLIDITRVENLVRDSGIPSGIVTVYIAKKAQDKFIKL